jgi:hypothetical protein
VATQLQPACAAHESEEAKIEHDCGDPPHEESVAQEHPDWAPQLEMSEYEPQEGGVPPQLLDPAVQLQPWLEHPDSLVRELQLEENPEQDPPLESQLHPLTSEHV